MAHRFCVWHFITTINHCCVLADHEEEGNVVTPALTVYLVKDTVKDTMAGITCAMVCTLPFAVHLDGGILYHFSCGLCVSTVWLYLVFS